MNKNTLLSLLNTARDRIIKQGSGCTDRMGACYSSKQKRDVISFLCAGNVIKWYSYGEISGEEQKYIVNHIANRHSINVRTHATRKKLIDFLQDLQNAHDFAFDQFFDVSGDRMVEFLKNCDTIQKRIENDR